MRRYLRWVLRVVAQFIVAGGFTRALDAWIVDLDTPWQLTALALAQLGVAHAYLESQRTFPPMPKPATPSGHQQTRGLRPDR